MIVDIFFTVVLVLINFFISDRLINKSKKMYPRDIYEKREYLLGGNVLSRSIYSDHEKLSVIKDNNSKLVYGLVWFVFYFSNRVDGIYNICRNIHKYRFKNKFSREAADIKFHACWDWIVLFYLCVSILVYFFCRESILKDIFIFWFIWRITTIVFVRLREIIVHTRGPHKFHSFPRTLILTFFNFVELIFAFAYIYRINDNGGLVLALNIFHSIIDKSKIYLLPQNIVMTIFVTVFIANLASMKYKDKD